MMTYRQLLRNLETMPESELDTCIRVEDYDFGAERQVTSYIGEFGYNADQQFVVRTDDLVERPQ